MSERRETVLTGARLVLEDRVVRGSLCLRDGLIADIDEGPCPRSGVDCEGDYVSAGLIELHTDNLERHISPRPGVDWPHAPAIVAHDAELAGVGITTVFDAVRVGSIVSEGRSRTGRYGRRLASEILGMRAEGALRISHFLHLRAEICSETLTEELAEFSPEDRVRIVSLMDHTPGQRQFRDPAALRRHLKGRLGVGEEEVEAHIALRRAIGAEHGPRHEAAVVAEGARLGAILASHDDTTEAHVALSAKRGVRLAEFPTTAEAARACHDRGIAVMMGAPNLIRGGSHSGNVAAQELAEAGMLDILSSDYVPAALLAAALRMGEVTGDLASALARVTSAPADAVQISDRGRLKPGLRADVIRFRAVGAVPVVRGVWVRGERVA